MTILCDGQELDLGLDVARDEPFAAGRGDARLPKIQLLIHESVTHDADPIEGPGDRDDQTERVLRRKKCGVHLMVGVPDADPGGVVIVQHNDLVDRLNHAGKQNAASVAVEVISPYYGPRIRPPWTDTLTARWVHLREYVIPTRAQLEGVWAIVQALTDVCLPGLEIPRDFVGLHREGKVLAMGRIKGSSKRPGIWAHHYTAHADGAFPVLYCLLRSRGADAAEAYDRAVRLAKGAGRSVKVI